MDLKKKYKIKKLGKIILILFLISVILGCKDTTPVKTVTVKELLDRPRDYENTIVEIEGEVTSTYFLFLIKFFCLRDKTGEIVVLTERILPKQGERIKIKGRLSDVFSVGGQFFAVIKEEKEEL